MIKRGDKRAQGLSTNAIILIVLGVVVLVVLVIGFTLGWDKIAPWMGSSNNVDTIVQQCAVACSTNSVYGYCSMERTLTDEGGNEITASCNVLAGIDKLQSTYGVEECNLCEKEECTNLATTTLKSVLINGKGISGTPVLATELHDGFYDLSNLASNVDSKTPVCEVEISAFTLK